MSLIEFKDNIFAENNVFESIEENDAFRDFVGQCLSHFIHFVIPRRDQTHEISQEYEIPENASGVLETSLMLTRSNGNRIVISFANWR